MPKILINELDKTTPGTPGDYSNFNVLVAGFAGREQLNTDTVQPDSNGVFEFSSVDDFVNTIGLIGPTVTIVDEYGNAVSDWQHYGNQMAYELLKMGCTIYYKLISNKQDKVNEVTKEAFWNVFRDKANYDFRFITHGFLDTPTATGYKAYPAYLYANDMMNIHAERTRDLTVAKNALQELIEAAEKYYSEVSVDAEKLKALKEQYIQNYYNEGEQYANKYAELSTDGELTEDDEKLLEVIERKHYAKTYKGFVKYTVNVDELTIVEGSDYYAIEEFTQNVDEKNKASEVSKLASVRAGLTKQMKDIETAYCSLSMDGVINQVNARIATLATYVHDGAAESKELPGRGDCIALIELDEGSYTDRSEGKKPEILIKEAIDKLSSIDESTGCYCALTVPSVVYTMSDEFATVTTEAGGKEKVKLFNGNKKFPGAFHYLACFFNMLNKGFREWYAAAGYTRGVASYVIDKTTVKLGEAAINVLEPRNITSQESDPKFACNVIANFRGSYYLWGNRTACALGDATGGGDLLARHFLNIRQLCATIKKQLYVSCRRFTFDPNSDTLWFNFVNAIKPTLEAMKADQGIRDYRIIKVQEEHPKKATLKAKIRIIPIEAVEDFDIELSLEDSFGETAVNTADSL